MHFREDQEELFISEVPIYRWIIGILALLCLTILVLWLFKILVYNLVDLVDFVQLIFFGGLLILCIYFSFFEAGYNSGVLAPVTTVTIRQKEKYVEICTRRFYGKSVRRFYFYQVKKFKSFKGKKLLTPHYYLTLKLQAPRPVKLWISLGGDKSSVVKLVRKLNAFVRDGQAAA